MQTYYCINTITRTSFVYVRDSETNGYIIVTDKNKRTATNIVSQSKPTDTIAALQSLTRAGWEWCTSVSSFDLRNTFIRCESNENMPFTYIHHWHESWSILEPHLQPRTLFISSWVGEIPKSTKIDGLKYAIVKVRTILREDDTIDLIKSLPSKVYAKAVKDRRLVIDSSLVDRVLPDLILCQTNRLALC